MPTKSLLKLLILASTHLSTLAFADTVVIKSGERLGGKIIHKSGDTLTLRTDYAGEIKIQWSKVASIATDAPITLQLEGTDDPLKAKLDASENQQVALSRDGQPVAAADVARDGTSATSAAPATGPSADQSASNTQLIPIARVLYINPLPEETRGGIAYKGRVNLSYSRADGNTNNEALYGETAFTARAREYRYELNAKGNRTEDNGVLTNSSWLTAGNYDRFLDPKHFIYGRASVEHDVFKGIQRRDVVGGGYGLQLVETPQTQLSVRGGLDYVTIRHTASPDENYPSLGWGIKASHKLDSYRAELFHEQEGFVNITDASQITLRTRSGLRVPLMAGINATSQLNVDWEKHPEPGRKPTDSMLLFGLGYEW